MRFPASLITAGLLILAPHVRGQEVSRVPDVREHLLTSQHVDEEYLILVSLPDGYGSAEREYPVLYVTDAEKSFGLARDIAAWLAWGREAPSMIVVGISYGESVEAWWQKRSRDFSPSQDESEIWGEWPLAGGADAFRRFLTSELFPFIEETYRTSSDRVYVGLSFGGLFGAYDLLGTDRSFNRYILVSPAFPWNYDEILKTEAALAEETTTLRATVYSAIGTADSEVMVDSWHRFNAQFSGRDYEGLYFRPEAFEGETHLSVFPIALTHGLKWVFGASGSEGAK
jgi:predicted alpha/beta superfamily hydrolase